MRFVQFQKWLLTELALPIRIRAICFWYVLALMVDTRKHSQQFAVRLSGCQPSQFSRLLRRQTLLAAYTLETLAKRHARQWGPVLDALDGVPWKIALLIDATIQTRAGLHVQNGQRFNHGQGFVFGHQWTNIVLIRNGVLIPLPPIPFYSKNYCHELKIPYQTEHDRLIVYLTALHLEAYIGPHCGTDVVVLNDSGYDVKKIQQTILKKQWHFLGALKASRGVKSPAQYRHTPKSTGWTGIAQFFHDHRRLTWQTIGVPTRATKKTAKPSRMEFRVRQTTGYLKGLGARPVQLVCSECKRRRHGRRKYLACSDLCATPGHILAGYRIRWQIEIFHKQIKQYLGFEDVAPTAFPSVETHVFLVYCAYILLHREMPGLPPQATTLLEKQHSIQTLLDRREQARILQQLTQFGGLKKYLDELKAVLSGR